MPVYVGLLRAVNLGPHNKIAMADLRRLLATLGLEKGQTLLQSGNVVFHGSARSTTNLEHLLEDGLATHAGLATECFVRSASEWQRIIAGNPFPDEAREDPGHLLLLCLKDAIDETAVRALQRAIAGRERVAGAGCHAYIVYPDGVGRSRLTAAVIERTLGTRSTGRNWNTVLKLGALSGAV